MKIICDFCTQPLFDAPLSHYDPHTNITRDVPDGAAHATTYHRNGQVIVEIRDDMGTMLGYGQHDHPEMPL